MSTVKRTVLITGCSSGIGRAIARKLLGKNHLVLGVSRDCRQFDVEMSNFIPLEMDLGNLTTLPKHLKSLRTAFPDIDAAVFAAGTGLFGSLDEFSFSQIESLITVNFTSQAFLARELLPGFRKRTRSDMIFIGSEAALKGSRKGAVYCASKFALRGFTQALREECSRCGVRVALINPGMVKTAFYDHLSFRPGLDESNFLRPEDVAEAVCYIMDSNANIVIDEINLNPLNKVVNFKKSGQ